MNYLQKTEQFTSSQIQLIKSQIAVGASDDQLNLFLHVASRAGLDPLAKQIYAIQRGGKMTIQTAIDGFRAIADRTGHHISTSDAVFEEENGRIIKATVTVQKAVKGLVGDFTATAYFNEYNANGPMWKKMPHAMIAKCAEALALRKAFSVQLTGLYTSDEMDQADNKDDDKRPEPSIKDITPDEDTAPAEDTTLVERLNNITAAFSEIGISRTELEEWQGHPVEDSNYDEFNELYQYFITRKSEMSPPEDTDKLNDKFKKITLT
ncbi:MAG: phage recombination protein Bet [Nitrospina sp.]|jgi:phage recombination protein Bet|nr:phage recombination protein Bet [Nitrospina sp.]